MHPSERRGARRFCILARPHPPDSLSAFSADLTLAAPEVEAWARLTFIGEDGPLANEDHAHLRDASIGILWTNALNQRQGVTTLGTAQLAQPNGKPWTKSQREQQLRTWFGEMPDFLITLYAPFWADCADADACALMEHELYHCAQKKGPYGELQWTKDGRPRWTLRPHDVEEFVGVTRRYGAGAIDGSVQRLVDAASEGPTVGQSSITRACCGTCKV